MADSVALTALIVSLVALFATIGQLLQQYFATADGYRRCQPSVVGLWAKKTKLRWRWREFRFETIFVVPRIKYEPPHPEVGRSIELSHGFCSMINTTESLTGSMTFAGWESSWAARRYYESDQLACWVPLLAKLHIQGADTIEYFPREPESLENDIRVPIVQFVEKSWDFMPPDIVRPMASSTVSDIAVMARRLGMVWKSFDPSSGNMRAEGNGHVFTSTMVRSLDTVLQYTHTARKNAWNCAYIPLKQADKLGFGLVEFDFRVFGPGMEYDLDLGSYEGISRTLPRLLTKRRDGRSSKHYNSGIKHIVDAIRSKNSFIPGVNDLVPICSAMLSNPSAPEDSLWQMRIPSPNFFDRGVTSSPEGFSVFDHRLSQLISAKPTPTDQSKHISQCLKTINLMSEGRWEFTDAWDSWSEDQARSVRSAAKAAKDLVRQYVRDLFLYHTEATDFLRYNYPLTFHTDESKISYHALIVAHLRIVTVTPSDPIPATSSNSDRNPEHLQAINAYFDNLPRLIEHMVEESNAGPDKCRRITPDEAEDAWLTMMFRAFCWQRCHVWIPDVPPLESGYWNSNMPVYIG